MNINKLIQSQTADIKEAIISRKDIVEEIDVHKSKLYEPYECDPITSYAEKYSCDPFTSYSDDYVDETVVNNLVEFCEKQKYTPENGHSVVMFGEEYVYNRHTRPAPAPIPKVLQSLIEKVNTDNPEGRIITQVLIKKYAGEEAFLPLHSDNEKTIAPNSSIYTFSLGTACTINFKNIKSGEEKTLNVKSNSLYVMSRTSQHFWCHGIEKSSELADGTRYSITLRTVEKRYMNSSLIIVHSNIKYFKF